MDTSPEFVEWRDAEHLRLLRIFRYAFAGVYALTACIPILHFGLGVMLAFRPDVFDNGKGDSPPAVIGYIVMGIAGAFIVLGWIFAALTAWSGHCIQNRRHRIFSIILGGLHCLMVPFGTILGVFTIMVLERSSVRELYARTAPKL